MMPTDESVTVEDNFAAIAYGLCPIKHAPASMCATCDNIEKEIRAAVEAEQKRIEREVVARLKEYMVNTYAIRAVVSAIRAKGEKQHQPNAER
jgi:hypothetical protein